MAYFNPFQMTNTAAFQNFPGCNQRQPIDQQQFRQFAITLDDATLQRFANLARQQGISELDIQNGINFIRSL